MPETPQRLAAIVQPDAMRKTRPGERVDLQDIVQELDQFIGAGANLLHLCRLLDGIEIFTYMVDAAPRGGDDVIETGKVADEQRLSVYAVVVETAICHGLS